MADLICTCPCGHEMQVSEYAVGMKTRCPRCGQPLEVAPANTRLLGPPVKEIQPEFAAKATADLDGVAGQQTCARCGKKIRGEWDRYSTPTGIVCHVCSHLITERIPGTEPPRPVTPPPSVVPAREESAHVPLEKETLADQFAAFRETRAFRIGLYAAAFAVMGAGAYYSIFPPPAPAVQPAAAAAGQETGGIGLSLLGAPEALTKGQNAVVIVLVHLLDILLWALPCFLAILVTHLWSGGLPGSTWWAGLPHMAFMAFIVSILGETITILFVGWLMGLYILHEVYAFRLGDLFRFVVCMALFGALTTPVRMLVFGAIGWAFF